MWTLPSDLSRSTSVMASLRAVCILQTKKTKKTKAMQVTVSAMWFFLHVHNKKRIRFYLDLDSRQRINKNLFPEVKRLWVGLGMDQVALFPCCAPHWLMNFCEKRQLVYQMNRKLLDGNSGLLGDSRRYLSATMAPPFALKLERVPVTEVNS